jgi:hypothetical protein
METGQQRKFKKEWPKKEVKPDNDLPWDLCIKSEGEISLGTPVMSIKMKTEGWG